MYSLEVKPHADKIFKKMAKRDRARLEQINKKI